jgi:(p)ppGpp synthase/HD superfamily hydrolase
MEVELIGRARQFAVWAHGNQKRKYTFEPYWHHLQEVATILQRHDAPAIVIAAGWLHDTFEDTEVQPEQMIEHFGETLSDLVLQVTDVSRKEHGNRAFRKRLDRQYLAGASWHGQMIKCADMLSNTRDIMEHDRKFAKVYIPEKRELVDVLDRAQRHCYPIWRECFDSVTKAELELARVS